MINAAQCAQACAAWTSAHAVHAVMLHSSQHQAAQPLHTLCGMAQALTKEIFAAAAPAIHEAPIERMSAYMTACMLPPLTHTTLTSIPASVHDRCSHHLVTRPTSAITLSPMLTVMPMPIIMRSCPTLGIRNILNSAQFQCTTFPYAGACHLQGAAGSGGHGPSVLCVCSRMPLLHGHVQGGGGHGNAGVWVV